jgi:SAM-dependent methyltransferase
MAPMTRNEQLARNLRMYDRLWADARLVEPERFNTWPLVQSLVAGTGRRLEVAPGLRPRLPLDGTVFVDVSAPALAQLGARGAQVILGNIASLPFPDEAFDVVCALDIIEHVDDDHGALSELIRVCRPGGTLLLSTPLHPSRWTAFDDFVGHRLRYEPPQLLSMLAQHGLRIDSSAVFGMQPKSSRLLDWGMWWLNNHREHAMQIYNRTLMPLGLRFQKPLQMVPGVIAGLEDIDEILMVCRREPA